MEIGARVNLTIKRSLDQTVIMIADNGVGMSDEVRRSLLSIDSPASFSTPASSRSTGLGLQNVFKRLRLFYACDDIIDIESQLGRGTIVTLRLPILKGA
jgi:sensor histidine kinase YesM